MTNTQRIVARLRTQHPRIDFQIISKSDTAYADDDAVPAQLIGVVVDGMQIHDPFASSCGEHFTADPETEYGLPKAVAEQIKKHNRIG